MIEVSLSQFVHVEIPLSRAAMEDACPKERRVLKQFHSPLYMGPYMDLRPPTGRDRHVPVHNGESMDQDSPDRVGPGFSLKWWREQSRGGSSPPLPSYLYRPERRLGHRPAAQPASAIESRVATESISSPVSPGSMGSARVWRAASSLCGRSPSR